MRKIHVILLAVFTTGVLCGGIGTGIAFGEYSSMEYGGHCDAGRRISGNWRADV